MSVNELASYFKVHPATIYRLVNRDALPAVRIGNDWQFDKEAIDEWRRKQEQNAN